MEWEFVSRVRLFITELVIKGEWEEVSVREPVGVQRGRYRALAPWL